jgi:hypothetical protein
MQLQHADGSAVHLTYCSNIHAGESLREVMDNIVEHIPAVRRALGFDSALGLGLRLSAAAAHDLAAPAAMDELKQILQQQNCYVFTINGFPYGPFHGTRVKEDVYLPDWKDRERLRYTNQLADLFCTLLPGDHTGSISTVPGAFKTNVQSEEDIARMTSLYVEHCAHLVKLERQTGKSIILALEPEPCCFLETIEEAIDFFASHLYSAASAEHLRQLLDDNSIDAPALLRKHLTLCLDLCHAAVEYENANDCIEALRQADIGIGKLQISAGLRLTDVTVERAACLKPFIDPVYLHQVIEQHGNEINRYPDLPLAFEQLSNDGIPREWRVHFHVPIFLDDLGEFSSTQFFIKDALNLHKEKPISTHLEVETYTWDVLPEQYKGQPITDAIARELNWVSGNL